jgi:hypothetical protein
MTDDVGSNRFALVHPARTAVIVALVAALLLVGLLLLERSGPSPVQRLQSVSPAQPAAASATGSGGQSSALARTAASPSRLANASISGAASASQITPVAGDEVHTCKTFIGGNGTTLSTATYDTKGTTIDKIGTPGQFLYWVQFPVTSTGPQTLTITQVTNFAPTTGTAFFAVMNGSTAFDSGCNSLATTITGSDASVTVSFTAAAAGTYNIGVQFATHGIIGADPASTTSGFSYNYTFATTGLSGSTQGLLLTHV